MNWLTEVEPPEPIVKLGMFPYTVMVTVIGVAEAVLASDIVPSAIGANALRTLRIIVILFVL